MMSSSRTVLGSARGGDAMARNAGFESAFVRICTNWPGVPYASAHASSTDTFTLRRPPSAAAGSLLTTVAVPHSKSFHPAVVRTCVARDAEARRAANARLIEGGAAWTNAERPAVSRRAAAPCAAGATARVARTADIVRRASIVRERRDRKSTRAGKSDVRTTVVDDVDGTAVEIQRMSGTRTARCAHLMHV